MNILTLGDIHGENKWMTHTHGSPRKYYDWAKRVSLGVPADSKDFNDLPYLKYYDKVIFVGDYVDSYYLADVDIKHNLEQIFFFARALGDRCVLLIGNHDVSYIVPDQMCSGYRRNMKDDYGKIYSDNMDLLKAAHEEVREGGTYLWTHAGVIWPWLPYIGWTENVNIADAINAAWDRQDPAMFCIDEYSGGWHKWASPFWVRPVVLDPFHVTGINQIVGHTPHRHVTTTKFNEPDKDNTYSITYADALNGNDEAYYLSI